MGDWAINGKPIASGWKINGQDVAASSNQDWGENASPQDWSDNPPQKKPTDAEILAKYGIGVRGGPSLTPDQSIGAAFLARHAGPGTFLGDASDTTMGKIMEGMASLPLGIAQRLSHLTGHGQEADAYVKLLEGLKKANQDPRTQFKPLPVVGDPAELAGALATPIPGAGEMKGATGVAKALGIGGLLGALQPNPNVQYDDEGNSNYESTSAKDALKSAAINLILHGAIRTGGNLIAGKKVTPAPGDVTKLGENITQRLSGSAADDAAQLQAIAQTPGPRGGLSIRSDAAQKILDELQQTGNNPTEQIQLSARAKKVMEQADLDKMFAARDEAMQGATSTAPRTVATLNDEIATMERNPARNEAALNELRRVRNNLLGNQPEYSTLVGPNGEALPSTTPPVAHDFQDLSNARSSIKQDVRSYYTGKDVATGSIGADVAQRVADALSEDLSAAARVQGGNAEALDKAANQAYAAYSTKWRTAANRNLLTSTTPDELLNNFARAGEDRAMNAKEAMTPMGHEAVQSIMFKKIMDDSQGDPSKYLSSIKTMKESMPVFFEGDSGRKLNGLTKIMQVSKNIGAASGPTIGLTAGALTGNPLLAAAGAMGGGIMQYAHFGEAPGSAQSISRMAKYLLSTPQGQQWLLKASEQKPYSPKLQQIMSQVSTEAALTSGVASGPPKTPRQQAMDMLLGNPQ